jgi:hypothetical protein
MAGTGNIKVAGRRWFPNFYRGRRLPPEQPGLWFVGEGSELQMIPATAASPGACSQSGAVGQE